jgi:putative sterol carrier protein
MKIFSPEWAQLYQTAINDNVAYADSSQKWEAGKLAMVLIRADGDSAAVLLDLLHGVCHGVVSTTPESAAAAAAFVIEGDETTWRNVLEGKLQPLMGIMSGKLKLSKGSLAKLMPFTKAAAELVNSARTIPAEW